MATNHNININLNGSGGQSNLKTSAKRSVQQIRQNNTSKFKLSKVVSKVPQAFNANSYGSGSLKRMGFAGAVAFAGVTLANKALDMYLDIRQASTGDILTTGNIKRTKNYILNPVRYFVDDVYAYGFLQQKITNRQNEQNQYYRELTGKAIVGNQYGVKR
jgi:hypothetical protein